MSKLHEYLVEDWIWFGSLVAQWQAAHPVETALRRWLGAQELHRYRIWEMEQHLDG